jgi:enoyl-CoA hydratase/carnithine racemase
MDSSSNDEVLISVDHQKHIGTITLNRPQRANAITPTMGIAIKKALDTWEKDINSKFVS